VTCDISFSGAWIVIVTQSCKLAHLFGLPSSLVFSLLAVALSYTLPFVFHSEGLGEALAYSFGSDSSSLKDSLAPPVWEPQIGPIQISIYAVGGLFVSHWAMVSSFAIRFFLHIL
jgi:hypothetical protein